MPAILIKSPAFQSRGIALASSSCVEQVNGLVEVQTSYVVDQARQNEIDRLFFVDAQPPIEPSCITKASLLTQRLYMVTRSVSSQNGYLNIEAAYVGALARPGSQGFYLTEGKGPSTVAASFLGQLITPITGFSFNSSMTVYIFRFYSKEITVEFVEIGSASSVAIPTFSFFDLFVLEEMLNVFGGARKDDLPGQIFANPIVPLGVRRTVEPTSFVTPTVRIQKIRFSI